MAGHIGLQVVAEGVETREQLQFLRAANCAYYQGYLGCPPLSLERFCEELRFNADLYASTERSLKASTASTAARKLRASGD